MIERSFTSCLGLPFTGGLVGRQAGCYAFPALVSTRSAPRTVTVSPAPAGGT